jgi:phenylacetate-CoA ligase
MKTMTDVKNNKQIEMGVGGSGGMFMYANPFAETMPRESLTQLQGQLLSKTVKWAYEKTAFYHTKLDEAGVKADDIKTIEDVKKLPFTRHDELVKTAPLDFVSGPLSTMIRLRLQEASNIVRAYTGEDVGRNVEMVTRGLVAGGVNRGSLVALVGQTMDEAILDVQYAAEVLGATVVPFASDFIQSFRLIEQFGVDTIIGDPTRILQLIIMAQSSGKDIRHLPIRSYFCLNEAVQNPLEEYLKNRTDAEIYDLYVSNDLGCTGMLFSCPEKGGLHIAEDYFYPEVLNFSSPVPAEKGQMGELVVTALAQQAMPVLRYRTGQAVILKEELCQCGRTSLRILTPFAKGK